MEQGHGRSMAVATSGAIQAVVADFSQAPGQNMLEKALHELCQGKPESLDLLSAIVPIAKGNLAVLQIFQARLSDGNTENIAP